MGLLHLHQPVRNFLRILPLLSAILLTISSLKSQPYIGEIRIFAGNFPPAGWMFCDGTLLPISENVALFSLIGTTYGGDGVNTFALPDLRGRAAVHLGIEQNPATSFMGASGGTYEETLLTNHIPAHNHMLGYNKAKGDNIDPTGNYPARNAVGVDQYGQATGKMNSNIVTSAGGSQPHNNLQPYNTSNYIISLFGIFPSQTKDGEEEYKLLNQDGTITNFYDKSIEPFIAEIKIFAFNFAPKGWAQCNGQLLPINQNQALFALVGTTYGGNGTTNFALPNIRDRVPVHYGQGPGLSNWGLGETKGARTHSLTVAEIPSHSHSINSHSSPGNHQNPADHIPAVAASGVPAWSSDFSDTNSTMVAQTGSSLPHNNMQPYLTLNYGIALQGVFPSRDKDDGEKAEKGIDPFVGEINIFAFNFAPRGYLSCNGQLLSISQNTALFSLLGTYYGGDGKSTFGIPDYRGRVVLHPSYGAGNMPSFEIGKMGGTETETLTLQQIPAHSHLLMAASEGTSDDPSGKTFAPVMGGYSASTVNSSLHPSVLSAIGGNQPHNNIMPSIGLHFTIATQGIFPPRSK